MVKGGVLPVVICAALAAIPVAATAESRFVAGEATASPQMARLDFTIKIPVFISLEMGTRARGSAAAGAIELPATHAPRADRDAAQSANHERIVARAVSNSGTLATGSLLRQNAAYSIALP